MSEEKSNKVTASNFEERVQNDDIHNYDDALDRLNINWELRSHVCTKYEAMGKRFATHMILGAENSGVSSVEEFELWITKMGNSVN